MPNTASASVLPVTCAMPQLSRTISIAAASWRQRASSPARAAPARASKLAAKSAVLFIVLDPIPLNEPKRYHGPRLIACLGGWVRSPHAERQSGFEILGNAGVGARSGLAEIVRLLEHVASGFGVVRLGVFPAVLGGLVGEELFELLLLVRGEKIVVVRPARLRGRGGGGLFRGHGRNGRGGWCDAEPGRDQCHGGRCRGL